MTTVVVDTSAAVAIINDERGGEDLAMLLEGAGERIMSAAGLVELGIVLESRFGVPGAALADRFVRDGEIHVVPVDRRVAEAALIGWRRFGKGRHRAALNFGDCFTYGLAVDVDAAIMCVGDDFAATDIDVIRPSGWGRSAAPPQ